MNHIPKYKIPVRVSIAEEGAVMGAIFIRQEQRILDMLCDQHQFFPLSTKTGMLLINKTSVLKVEVLEKAFIEQNEDSFPDEEVTRDFEIHAELKRRRARNMQPA
jgi:hypothetical protein